MTKIKLCPVCKYPMVYIAHIEDDGDLGSDEGYYECVNGCEENEDKSYEQK